MYILVSSCLCIDVRVTMKSYIPILLLLICQLLLGKTPNEFSNQYHEEVSKIDGEHKVSLANSRDLVLKRLKSHLEAEQKLGKLKQVLSLKKFISKLEKGDYILSGLDLVDSPNGQAIFEAFEKESVSLEERRVAKKEKLLVYFKKAMGRKVTELTKAGNLEEAINFQKLADNGPYEVKESKISPAQEKNQEIVEAHLKKPVLKNIIEENKSGALKDGFYQASTWNERSPAFVAIEDGKAYLIRINSNKNNKKLGLYTIKKWPFIANPLCIAANGKPSSFTYLFFDKFVKPPSDVIEFFHNYKDGSKFPLTQLKGDLPKIRKITDEELKTLPEKFRIREVN